MKVISLIAGIAAIVAVVLISLRFKKAAVQTGLASGACGSVTLKNFVNTVEEAAGYSIPDTEGVGTGGFTGWRSNQTGHVNQPNVINGTGATAIANNPVIEWTGSGPSGQLPDAHEALPGAAGYY